MQVAIHEVMEQQTVTIAKAGIQASLNARCSVLAAANPIYGQYDASLSPQKNVHLPDSLLSRFDLMFIVQDSMDEARDRSVADHVLRMHRYVRPGHEGVPIPLDAIGSLVEDGGESLDAAADAEPWEKFNPLLHGGAAQAVAQAEGGGARKKPVELLKISFLKKFVSYAKARVKPELSDGARELIVQHYAELRQKQVDGGVTVPITARALETIIRLSTAHAKSRLSKWVEVSDVKVAFGLMEFALYHDSASMVAAAKRKKRAKAAADGAAAAGPGGEDGDSSSDEDGGDEGKDDGAVQRRSREKAPEGPSGSTPGRGEPTPRPTPRQSSPSPTRKATPAATPAGSTSSPARGTGSSRAQQLAASAKKRPREESEDREPSSDARREPSSQEPLVPVNRDDPSFKQFMGMLATRSRLERLVSAPLTKVIEWVQTERLTLTRIQVVSFLTVRVRCDAAAVVLYCRWVDVLTCSHCTGVGRDEPSHVHRWHSALPVTAAQTPRYACA